MPSITELQIFRFFCTEQVPSPLPLACVVKIWTLPDGQLVVPPYRAQTKYLYVCYISGQLICPQGVLCARYSSCKLGEADLFSSLNVFHSNELSCDPVSHKPGDTEITTPDVPDLQNSGLSATSFAQRTIRLPLASRKWAQSHIVVSFVVIFPVSYVHVPHTS